MIYLTSLLILLFFILIIVDIILRNNETEPDLKKFLSTTANYTSIISFALITIASGASQTLSLNTLFIAILLTIFFISFIQRKIRHSHGTKYLKPGKEYEKETTHYTIKKTSWVYRNCLTRLLDIFHP